MSESSGLLLRRGPTEDRLNFFPLKGELIFDSDQNIVYVGDGATAGGLSVFGDFIKISDREGRTDLDIIANISGGLRLPKGGTSDRTPTETSEDVAYSQGMIRFNSDTSEFEGYDGTSWGALGNGGAADSLSRAITLDDLNTTLQTKINLIPADPIERSEATEIATDVSTDLLSSAALAYDAVKVWQFGEDDEDWLGQNVVLSVDTPGILTANASAAVPRFYYNFENNESDLDTYGRGEWVARTSYSVDDVVLYAGQYYECLTSHQSDIFKTALDLGYWQLFQLVNEEVNAGIYKNVTLKVKRVAGTGWSGKLFWDTGTGFETFTRFVQISEDPTKTSGYVNISFDLTGESTWTGNIKGIMIELGETSEDIFDIDWIAIGNEAPAGYTAAIQQQALTQAQKDGLIQGQYNLKVDAGGYVVGFGLMATNDPVKGETDSEFVIRANTFKLVNPNDSEIVPFEVTTSDGGSSYQTTLNSNVKINGNTIIDGTLSTDQLTVGGTNNFVTGNDILTDSDIQNALRGPAGNADFIDLSLTSNFFVKKNTTTDTPTDIASTGTISYGSDARNIMDYYLPTGKTKGVVLYIHGGGWSSGSKDYPEFLQDYKPAILANGYALLSMEYRLAQDPIDYTNPISGPFNQNADDHAWPAQLNDVKKVLALLMSDDESVSSNQTEWTTLRDLVKSTAFMVTGESAGGHLAIMGVFEYALDTDGVWPDAVFNNVGPMDLRSTGPDDPNNPFGQAGINIRATFTENDPDKINSASAAFRLATWKGISNYYTNNTKFYFYANNNDTIVPPTSITPFVEELTQDLGANQVTYLRETVGTPTAANPGNGYLLGDPNPTQYVADHNITFEKNAELAKANSLSGLSTVLTPDSIKITPTKNGALQDSVLSFSTDPSVTLIDDGDSKVLKAIDFEGNESTTVTVSTTSEDTEFSKQSTILLVQSGSSGEKGENGEKGDSGPRGSGRFFREITGSSWSDSEAEQAILDAGFDSPVAGDVVTLVSSSGDFTEDRLFDGTDWVTISLLVNGNAVIDGTLSARKLILGDGSGSGQELKVNESTGGLEVGELNADKITSGTIDADRLNLGTSILTSNNGILSINSTELNNAIQVDQVFTETITFTDNGKLSGDAIQTDGATITAEEIEGRPGEFELKLGVVSLDEISGGGKVTFNDGSIFAFENDDFRLGPYRALTGIRYDGNEQKSALLVAKTRPTGVFTIGVGSVGNDWGIVVANNDDDPAEGTSDTWPTGVGRNTGASLCRYNMAASFGMEANSNGSHPATNVRLGTYEDGAAWAGVFEGNVKFIGNVTVTGALSTGDANFLSLADTPQVFGSPGQTLVVNSAGNALVFSDGGGGAASFKDLTDTPSTIPTALAFVSAENGAIVYKDFNTVAGISAVAGSLAQRDISANLTANDFIIPSDKNLKRNIVSIDGELAVEALRNVQPKTFQYNDNDRQLLGFIAQDMEQYYPELITTNDDGHKQLSYSMITSVLWKQNQELLKRIEQLEKKLGDS